MALWMLFAVLHCSAQNDQSLVSASFFGSFEGASFVESLTFGRSIIPLPGGQWAIYGLATASDLYTSPDAYQSANPSTSTTSPFLTIMDAEGLPLYSSFYAGSGQEFVGGLAAGEEVLCVCGTSSSYDYPISPGAESTADMHEPGIFKGFVTCLDHGGDLLWSTFLGDSTGSVYPRALQIGPEGSVFVAGSSQMSSYGTDGAHQIELPDSMESAAFVARYSAEGELLWRSYYYHEFEGDFGSFNVRRVEYSPDGSRLYVLGRSIGEVSFGDSPYQSEYGGGPYDSYLAALSADDGELLWQTYFGGEGDEFPADMAVDASGRLYISGWTSSAMAIATDGAYRTWRMGNRDNFLASFSPDGQLLWATYYGGEGSEGISHIAVSNNVLYMGAGTTSQTSLTIGSPMYSSGNPYVSKWIISDEGAQPEWSTYLNVGCQMDGMALVGEGRLAIAGTAILDINSAPCLSSDFSTTPNAWQPTPGGWSTVWYVIVEDQLLSAAAAEQEQGWKLYPNPARSHLQLDGPLEAQQPWRIRNMLGQVMGSGTLQGPGEHLDISTLPAGLYLLELESKGAMQALKFVKE